MNFTAIDFETANSSRNTACALGIVRVSRDEILEKRYFLIRPPTRRFTYTRIHNIRFETVQYAPRFDDIWPQIRPLLSDAQFIVAHKADFDQSVLLACRDRYGLRLPPLQFLCSLKLARQRLPNLNSHKLPDVCSELNIEFNYIDGYHDALSDAEACAKIVLHRKMHRSLRELGFVK